MEVFNLNNLKKDYRISIDIKTCEIKSQQKIIFADADKNTSNIIIDFYNAKDKVDITNFTFIANVQKPDTLKHPIVLNKIDAASGVAEIILPLDVTIYEGEYVVEIEMKNEDGISHSNKFKYKVRETLCGDIDDSVIEDPVHNILIELLDTVSNLETTITKNEDARESDENTRKTNEASRVSSELERQENEKQRQKRVESLVASGTVDLETKDARTDVKGVVHPNLRAAMIANYNYLNTMSDIIWETVEG